MSPRIEELKECITLEQCLFETTGLTESVYRQCGEDRGTELRFGCWPCLKSQLLDFIRISPKAQLLDSSEGFECFGQ